MPRPTVRDLLERKRSEIRANRADFRSLLKSAPKPVRDEYRRCRRRIRDLLRSRRSSGKAESTIYDSLHAASKLGGKQVVRVAALLRHPANGWDVEIRLLHWGEGRTSLHIWFRFGPHAD